ncbi:helicase and polymerase-containing protein TEBICHI isoform X1 [Tanacetum coccineum]
MSAVNTPGGFDTFLNMWDTVNKFFFDIHYNKQSELHTIAPFEVQGIAVCWEDSPVYYISVPKDLYSFESKNNKSLIGNNNFRAQQDQLEMAKKRWCRICMIMGKNHVRKFGWNLKIQNQVLKHLAVSIQRFGCIKDSVKTMGVELIENSCFMFSPVHLKDVIDLCVVVWILWPDEERSSNPNLEKEVKKRLSSEVAAAANQKGRWKNQMRRAAHNSCCRQAAQTRALSSVLWKLPTTENPQQPLSTIEMPLVNVLADMELSGIGVDMGGCIQSRYVLGKKLRYTLHGHWLQTSTARLSMEDPNLQCVEHMVEFKIERNEKMDGDSETEHYKFDGCHQQRSGPLRIPGLDLANVGVFIRPEDIRLTRMALMKCVMQTWLPAANALLEMMILHLPSPYTAKKYHVENLYEGPSDDVYANAIRKCDPNGPLMFYVGKMIPASNESRHFFAFGRVFSCIVSPSMKVRIMGPNYVPGETRDLNVRSVQRTLVWLGQRQVTLVDVPLPFNHSFCLGLSKMKRDPELVVFSSFGPVLKIAMFDKNGGVQELIQYPDVQTAVVTKEALEGYCIYDGGFCKLHISYSRHTDLSIKAPP